MSIGFAGLGAVSLSGMSRNNEISRASNLVDRRAREIGMKPQRVFMVVVITGLFLVASEPALAKGDFEFVLSGGGLLRPVTVSSGDIYAAVHGEVWSPGVPPAALRGQAYALDYYDINGGGRRSYNGRWLYYPAAGGALIEDPAPAPIGIGQIRWERFSPAFQDVLNRAIYSRSSTPGSLGFGLGLVAVLLTSAVLLSRKRSRLLVA